MTLIEELDRIIAFAIPISDTDCKRIVSKKEWRREEAKKQILAWHMNIWPHKMPIINVIEENLPGVNNELVIPSSPNIIKENSNKINNK